MKFFSRGKGIVSVSICFPQKHKEHREISIDRNRFVVFVGDSFYQRETLPGKVTDSISGSDLLSSVINMPGKWKLSYC
jgi:hypothetical protein